VGEKGDVIKKDIIVVSHTHWDREWYLTFQEYRIRFLKIIRKLEELFEKHGKFNCFVLDGQTSLIEDLLEVHPEKENVIKKLVSEGKLIIGPLYTQPDEVLVSGESLIRNLLIGHRISKRFGKVMKVGYFPDTFGHIPQMPQILKGFNIDSFVFMRGLGDEGEELGREFIWEAPDGSQVIAIHLREGYCNANMLGVSNPYRWEAWEAPDGWKSFFLEIYYKDEVKADPEKAYKRFIDIVKRASVTAVTNTILLMNGCDHMPPQEDLPKIIEHFRKKGFNIIHGRLEDYIKKVRAHRSALKIYRGEMRGARYHPILAGVLSTRVYLKQLNHRAELLLEKYAEPLSTIAMIHGYPYPAKLLEKAWKLVLQNQAHDSIYGSGIDPLHLENEVRFLQAIAIASNVAYEAARFLVSLFYRKEEGRGILVFNPLSWERSSYITFLSTDLKPDKKYYLIDSEGSRILLEPLEPWGPAYRWGFMAENLPSLGLKTYSLVEADTVEEPERKVRACENQIENEFFRVKADPERGGVLEILDKENGYILKDINLFIDEGDAGDEYNYSPPVKGDLKIRSTAFRAKVTCSSTQYTATLRIQFDMEVPRKIVGQQRSMEKVKLPVQVEVKLYRGVRRIDFKVKVDNVAEDHRFRVVFPTGIKTSYFYTDSPFYVIKREIKTCYQKREWVEAPPTTYPMSSWIDVTDGKRGVMVVTRGLHEVEVSSGEEATIFLTLFRSVGWLSRNDLIVRRGHAGPPIPTPGAQCKRELVFEYTLIPHCGTWKEAFTIAQEYIAPPLTLTTSFDLNPTSKSLLKVSSREIVLTALKKHEYSDLIIARFCNMQGEKAVGQIQLGFDAKNGWITDLNEKPLTSVNIVDNTINFSVKPWKIITFLIERWDR